MNNPLHIKYAIGLLNLAEERLNSITASLLSPEICEMKSCLNLIIESVREIATDD